MARDIVPPGQLDLESPGRRDYWVALSHTSIWGSHLIPLTVMVGPGARPGEGLVAFGACHGNEYEGPVAIKHLLREIRTEDVLGRILLVPVLNVAAFRVGDRESTADDGYNLNRVFVEGAGTTPAMAGITHRIAAFVRESIWPHVHICIDLHSGGEVARFAHSVGFHRCGDAAIDARREQMARWFGTRVVTGGTSTREPPTISGGMLNEADRLGKHAIGTELGWGQAVDVRGTRYARHGVLAAAIHHELLRGEIEPIGHHADGTQILMRVGASVTAPYAGHYEPLYDCGEAVEQGRVVGLLHDFGRLDEEPYELVAGATGMVFSQAWGARVEQGQMIHMIGAQVD
jgi:N-alpha-acetyl-L-2,4-diaminobutyrate deacetylase